MDIAADTGNVILILLSQANVAELRFLQGHRLKVICPLNFSFFFLSFFFLFPFFSFFSFFFLVVHEPPLLNTIIVIVV